MAKDKEKKLDLGLLTDRRKYFEENMKTHCPTVHKFLIESVKDVSKRPLTDEESVSGFVYNFASDPETRHEAHWQAQTFILLEVLAESKKTNDLLEKLVKGKK